MDNDYTKRDYLLPEGCKDLIDVLKYQAKPAPKPPAPLPPIIGKMTVADHMTIRQLATVLNQTPYQIIADLMEVGVWATLNYQIEFDVIAAVVRKYGYTAQKTV